VAALEFAKSLPDILILDVGLPDMSGYDVCQKIKKDPLTSNISVLQTSASFVSDQVRALEAGADGYLTHPIDRMALVSTVRALLRLRAAEGKARKAAEEWQSAFNAIAEGLALVDSDGRVTRWNPAFEEICGTRFALQPGQDAGLILERIVGTREPLSSEQQHYSAQFSIGRRTVRLSVSATRAQAKQSERILILNDITDRKLAEYALLTAEKLAATGKLASAIAHEINNPLEGLTNLLYLAEHSASFEFVHDLVRRANFELARVSRVTKQTLSFHRDTDLPVAVDISDLIAQVIALFQGAANSRRVRLAFDCRFSLTLYGFPGQLGQVFGNLVRNAMEASPSDSQVCIRVRSIHRKGRQGARITISDRGPGIPEDVKEKMFDPFFTTKDLKGSGLGLWVSKTLISKHYGTIRFRSSQRVGSSGTTFEVFLPLGGLLPHSVVVTPAEETALQPVKSD
jgi:signal transduction histidine kinase